MSTTTKDKPKRLNLSQLCEKHGIPMWPKSYRDGLVRIGGEARYNELTFQIIRPVLRALHREGYINHDKVEFTGGGIFWFATAKGLKMRAGILAVEAERRKQKELGHGLVPETA